MFLYSFLWYVAEWVATPLIPLIDRALERWLTLRGFLPHPTAEETEDYPDLAPDPLWVAERAYWNQYPSPNPNPRPCRSAAGAPTQEQLP